MAPAAIAPWRVRMWAARRRVMLIVMTVMRLRRGKRRWHRGGNKLDNLGFMIPRMLADDLPRFVDEQRKFSGVKEELEAAKVRHTGQQFLSERIRCNS